MQGNEAAPHMEVTWKLEDGDAVADVPQVFGTSSAGFKDSRLDNLALL